MTGAQGAGNLAGIGAYLAPAGVEGWLVWDYAGTNPVFAHLLGTRMFLTRRAFILVTRDAPRLLISQVDATGDIAASTGCVVDTYMSHADLREWLRTHVAPLGSVAMEYSPHGDLPAVSRVDGGTLDVVRELGVDVASSADLFQLAVGAWSDESLRSHRDAMVHAVEIKDLAFDFVSRRLRGGERCSEHDVQEYVVSEFDARGLVSDGRPIVAVNEHSGNPHYEPTAERSSDLRPGDWLLLDLWCREDHDDAVFADITWMAYLGRDVPAENAEVFEVLVDARDAVVTELRSRLADGAVVRGFELDNVARGRIADAGYGQHFVHRTGHSLGPGGSVHGLGANLDDLETHDTRQILPGRGFTVEPGIYMPAFGARSEINVYVGAQGPEVTSPAQGSPVTVEV